MAQVLDSKFNVLIPMKIIYGQKLPKLMAVYQDCGTRVLPDKTSTSLSTECVDKKTGQ
jgi:hypothetical protein